MKEAFKDLLLFECHCGYMPSSVGPAMPEEKTIALRERLVKEEFEEFKDALDNYDVAGVADALADLIYVALGTAVRFGIDLPRVWEAVHAANLAKFGEGSWRDETGKIRKPENWVHPDIEGILAAQPPLADSYGVAQLKRNGEPEVVEFTQL